MTLRTVKIACVAPIGASAVWALWPLGSVGPAPAKLQAAASQPAPAHVLSLKPIELAAFRTPIWVVPPPAPPPPAAPPPPPPLKLQLIAITSEKGEGRPERSVALLYDPDQDKLLSLHEGDVIGGRRIDRITSEKVHIRDAGGGAERVLALRSDSSGGAP